MKGRYRASPKAFIQLCGCFLLYLEKSLKSCALLWIWVSGFGVLGHSKGV